LKYLLVVEDLSSNFFRSKYESKYAIKMISLAELVTGATLPVNVNSGGITIAGGGL